MTDGGFNLDIKINDDDVHIAVSGYSDIRNALSACVKVFGDERYVANLWSTLVNDNWVAEDDDGWDDDGDY